MAKRIEIPKKGEQNDSSAFSIDAQQFKVALRRSEARKSRQEITRRFRFALGDSVIAHNSASFAVESRHPGPLGDPLAPTVSTGGNVMVLFE